MLQFTELSVATKISFIASVPSVLLPLVSLHREAHAGRVRKMFPDQWDEDVHGFSGQEVGERAYDGVRQVGQVVRVLRHQVREDLVKTRLDQFLV